MGLVLEQEQPVLVVAVHVNLDLDGAGVDFLGLVKAGQDTVLLEPLGADGAHVHEADGLGVTAELVAHRQVTLEGGLDGGVIDGHFVQLGAERGVTAVVGPVGVDHLDFGDGGLAALLAEVLLAEFEVGQIHGQGFDIKAGLLFHVHAKNHGNPFLKLKTIGSPREGSQIMHYSATSMPSDLASSARRSSISS